MYAYATSDHTKNVATAITVSAFGAALKGTYVLQTGGTDATALPYQLAGVVVLDGKGNITSGEQVYSDVTASYSDKIASGTYFIGPDGRGTLTLNTGDTNIGTVVNGVGTGIEYFSLQYLSNSQVLIAKIDPTPANNPNPPESNESARGTMDLQTSVAPPTAGYAFVMSGTDVASASGVAYGGVLNIDSANTISGNGSISDEDLAGTVTPKVAISGTVSSPDGLGAVTFNLQSAFPNATSIQLTGYIIDGTHIELIESDNNGSGTGMSTGGIAIGRGSATGTFTGGASVFSGNFVFGVSGEDVNSGYLSGTLALAGTLTADGAGNLTGYVEEFLDSTQVSRSLSTTYNTDPNGTGRVATLLNHGNWGAVLYLTGNGNPPLILDTDNSIISGGGGLGTGIVYPAAASPSLSGKYGVIFEAPDSPGGELDASGQFTATAASTISGVLDENVGFIGNWDDTLFSGAFQSSTIPNRLTGTLQSTNFNSQGGPVPVSYYLIDSSHGFFVETDGAGPALGYFATRTPVCSTCQ